MADEKNIENFVAEQNIPKRSDTSELEVANKSLSSALSVSFVILKLIMVILVLVFLASGFRTVGPDEEGLVLRFGKIVGQGPDKILGPGAHWTFPYPIHEIIKIPVGKKSNLGIDSFWYYQSASDLRNNSSSSEPTLNPVQDGYCITRSEKGEGNISGDDDYNIVHSKWQLTYQINDAEKFYKNVYVNTDNLIAGQSYGDIIAENISPLLKRIFENAVVTSMVHYTIDEALASQDRIPLQVKAAVAEKLASIDSGISVVSVKLNEIRWPRQVNQAFLNSISAGQTRNKKIKEAQSYAQTTLNTAAGPVVDQLLDLVDGKVQLSDKQEDALWEQVAGQARQTINAARSYRTEVVETARANAIYLQQLLPEYKQRPKLVLQKLYQDAVEKILAGVEEKIILQPGQGSGKKEIRLMLNRDKTIAPVKAEAGK